MKLTFAGVRGSTPSPGPEFVRYGGHTSCVMVTHDGEQVPTLVLDAGTGLRVVTSALNGKPYRGSILLSHLHWDHVQGVPFFSAGDRDGSQVDVFLPSQDDKSGHELIAQFLSPPAFPISPDGLRGDWTFTGIHPETFVTQGFTITSTQVEHKGGRTFGYRISDGRASVGFVPDHAPAAGVSDDTLDTLRGVDVLIHDGQFIERERAVADDYGHATIADAIAFAEQVEAASLVIFHHGPHRTDDALDVILDSYAPTMPVIVAREGMTITPGPDGGIS